MDRSITASEMGKRSVKKRLGGKTKEEISEYMSNVRKKKTPILPIDNDNRL